MAETAATDWEWSPMTPVPEPCAGAPLTRPGSRRGPAVPDAARKPVWRPGPRIPTVVRKRPTTVERASAHPPNPDPPEAGQIKPGSQSVLSRCRQSGQRV